MHIYIDIYLYICVHTHKHTCTYTHTQAHRHIVPVRQIKKIHDCVIEMLALCCPLTSWLICMGTGISYGRPSQ